MKKKKTYVKPMLIKVANIKEVTLECPDWQCSVVVPPPPPPDGA